MFFDVGIKDFIDVLLVALLLYYTYKLMKASGSIKVFTGILVFILIWLVVTQVVAYSDKLRVENGELRVDNANDSVVNSPFSTLHSPFNLVYFDAFAPEKQPEMWSQELFNCLFVLLDEGGILTTYCAKGVVRRMLQTAGFTVERLPGPPGGKREILRARKTRNEK